jgi:hypothetical protein
MRELPPPPIKPWHNPPVTVALNPDALAEVSIKGSEKFEDADNRLRNGPGRVLPFPWIRRRPVWRQLGTAPLGMLLQWQYHAGNRIHHSNFFVVEFSHESLGMVPEGLQNDATAHLPEVRGHRVLAETVEGLLPVDSDLFELNEAFERYFVS